MGLVGSIDYVLRCLVFVLYYCSSLTTSAVILFYGSLFGAANRFTLRVRSIFSSVTCAPWLLCFGVRLAIENEEYAFPSDGSPVINIGTHASHIDGLSMMVTYWRHRHMRMPPCAVVKREVLFTPFYGPFAYFVGNVMVARGSTKEVAIESMDRVGQRMKDGYVIGAFPEGSRRRTPSTGKDHLLPFKKGVFHMIAKTASQGTPITLVPFCLIGSRSAWPKGRLIPVSGSKVLLKFCEPVQVKPSDTVDDLLERTRSSIENAIEAAARNQTGDYDINAAFKRGKEVNLAREFLFEALLLTIPPIATLAIAGLGLL
jgi:1-acyl-sn-glycerol-3-phosphate acyltransferase